MVLNPIVSTLNLLWRKTNSRPQLVSMIVKPFWTSVTKLLAGWTTIKLLKLMNFNTNKKKLRASVIQSFQSCINSLVVCLMEECQMELEHPMDKVLDPLLKKLINFAYHFI